MRALLTLLLWLCVTSGSEEEEEEVHLTNSWAVHIEESDLDAVNGIAHRHGFVNQGQIGSLPGYYHFVKKHIKHQRTRRGVGPSKTLLTEPKVKWVEQQRVLERSKRDVTPGEAELVEQSVTSLRRDAAVTISDPYYKDQWYLQNIGQSMGPPGVDINVLPVWGRGYSGKGVVVSILDDGVDHTHPDLKANYDPHASFDFNDDDSDPRPRGGNSDNCHGTKCAGEVAAEANNGICGVGVSFNASIGGIRMLDGQATDTLEGSSLSFRSSYIDIYSCCWGPKDDGKRFGKPGYLASTALKLGAERGRGGKGNIFVWATGNGGMTDDDCNCDGYTTSIYTVSIGAISVYGLSTYYTETCASTLAVTFSGGSHREGLENKIITTDLNHKCTGVFKGTSSSAPLAAGMLALVLEANPSLTWRDVQHLIVETSQVTSPLDEGWMTNGGGKRFNHKFGFGKLDVNKMVEKALVWKNVGRQRTCRGVAHNTVRSIPASGSLILSANTSACALTDSQINKLEHVQLVISLQHRHRGDLSITLISPSGTRSQLLTTRRNDHSSRGLKDWILMTVHFWGENPLGLWTLSITDNDSNNRRHYLQKVRQADVEDATKIIMHDSEKFDENELTSQYGGRVKQPANDHILKTMEDTEGQLFQVSKKFGKVKRKRKWHYHKGVHAKHHWKHKPFKTHHTGGHVSGRFHGKGSFGEGNFVAKSKNVKYPTAKRNQGGQKVFPSPTKHLATEEKEERVKAKANDSRLVQVLEPSNVEKELSQTNTKAAKNDEELHDRAMQNSQSQSKTNGAELGSSLGPPGNRGFRTFVSLDSRFNFSLTGFTHQNSETPKAEVQQTPLEWTLTKGMRNPLVARLFGMDLRRHETATKPTQSGRAFGNVRRGSGADDGAAEKRTKPSAQARENQTVFTSQGSRSNEVEVGIPYASETLQNVREQGSTINARDENAGSGSFGESGSGDMQRWDYENRSRKDNKKVENSNRTSSNDVSNQTNANITSNSVAYGATFSGSSSGADETFVINTDDTRDAIFESGDEENGSSVSENDATAQGNEKLVESRETSKNTGAEEAKDLCSFQNGGDGDVPCPETLREHKQKHKHIAYNKNEEELAHYLATDKLRESVATLRDGDTPKVSSKMHRKNEERSEESNDEDYEEQMNPILLDEGDPKLKDLNILEEALQEQLLRLPQSPGRSAANYEILSRVSNDINRGDVEDLELLESQLGEKIHPREARGLRSDDFENILDQQHEGFDVDDPGVSYAVLNDQDEEGGGYENDDNYFDVTDIDNNRNEPRSVSTKIPAQKWTQKYRVKADKYGKSNSGLLESWTLILYGTK